MVVVVVVVVVAAVVVVVVLRWCRSGGVHIIVCGW
jgi:hypothetical protein